MIGCRERGSERAIGAAAESIRQRRRGRAAGRQGRLFPSVQPPGV